MLGRCVALGLGQVVARILGVELHHQIVTGDLRDDAGGGDAGDARVALHERFLLGVDVQRVAVDEHAIGLNARVLDGAEHGLAQDPGHPHLVDARGRDVADADGRRHRADLLGKLAAPLGRELLGVVDAPDDGLVGKAHGTHRHRPRHGPAAHLVQSQHHAGAAHLAHEEVHALHALALRTLLGHAALRHAAGTLNLRSRVIRIALEQLGELCLGGLVQGRADLCGGCGVCGAFCHRGPFLQEKGRPAKRNGPTKRNRS